MKKFKNILLISKFSTNKQQYTYASSFQSLLKQLGYSVESFNCKQNLLPLSIKNHDQLAWYLKPINNFFINKKLKKLVRNSSYDLIFFIKAENISHKTTRYLKQTLQKKIIIFYPDNPFVFWNGNSNKNVLLSLPYYDHFLIWSKMLTPALQSAGVKNVSYFPFAYDENIYTVPSSSTPQKYDVCFAGTWDKEREQWLTKLHEQMPHIKLAIWGNLWKEKLPQHSPLLNFLYSNAIYKNDMISVFQQSKIILNFIRQQNMTSHNMRTFEVPATKSFLLTQRTAEQTALPFIEGENIECFSTVDELTKKLAFYLKNDTLRKRITDQGFQAVQDYTITKQLAKLLKRLEDEAQEKA